MNNFKLFESKHHVIYLYEEGQLYIGRSIVELKSKKSSIAQMTDEEWTDFGYVSRIYENAGL